MAEKPILFSGEMVRAILDGKKTQTRRVIKDVPESAEHVFRAVGKSQNGNDWKFYSEPVPGFRFPVTNWLKCPYGRPGDLLWVRETHYQWVHWVKNGFTLAGRQKWRFVCDDKEKIAYLDAPPENILKGYSHSVGWYKRNSIFMPRWASRITLRVTDVRVERVQDISDTSILAEGIPQNGRMYDPSGITYSESLRNDFCNLWNSINGPRGFGWDANPWVWVVEFEMVR